MDWSALCAFWRFCIAVLYLVSKTEDCCASWVSLLSICETWVWVALICAWFGAGPGKVVDVVAAAPPAVRTNVHAPRRAAAATEIRTREVRLRTVPRHFTAPTAQRVMAATSQTRYARVSVRLQPEARGFVRLGLVTSSPIQARSAFVLSTIDRA